MARIDLDLGALTAARKSLQDVAASQRAADLGITALKAALDAAVRDGASSNVTVPIQEQLRQAMADRAAVVRQKQALQARIDALANGLLQQQDPSRLVGSMDGRQPIALLPMRIETRYVPAVQPNAQVRPDRLRIRVYPDDINTIAHEAALTVAEQKGGADYWTARFARADDDAARTLRDLGVAFGRGRAALIVRAMTPTNAIPPVDADPAAPQFPDVDTIDALAKATRAVLLPDRWCAIGYAANRREVFRAWGNRIPDELLLSPDWLASDDPEALLGGERAWMVDFDAALANGMALEITQDDVNSFALRNHAPRFTLATDTIDRLVVFGLEWTKSPDDSVAEFTDLLAAHRDSTGLGFVPLGTPTNNTEVAPSGYSTSEERATPAPPASDTEKDALQLTAWAFGIDPATLPADQIVNAHLAEQRTALHMMNVLWRGTMGHWLNELWNMPGDEKTLLIKTPTLYDLRRYAVSYVRPTGPLPLLRIHAQPYAILPMVGKRFVDGGDSALETGIAKVIGVLRPMWQLATGNVPLMKDGDVATAQKVLQTGPWSQTAYYRDRDPDPHRSNIPGPWQKPSGREVLIDALLAPFGVKSWQTPITSSSEFLPDGVIHPGYLAGVPWVLADDQDPKLEAPDAATLKGEANYLANIAAASIKAPSIAAGELQPLQAGPSLLAALASYSVQMEQGDAAVGFALSTTAVDRIASLATPKMPFVETVLENEALFTVQTPKELANVTIPAATGRATIGEFVAQTVAAHIQPVAVSTSYAAATTLFKGIDRLVPHTRNLAGVKLSVDYLKDRTVGELNIALRSTLDVFSYRLDAWIAARANRRLEALRTATPTGLHVGGYAWVEHLKADQRPETEGALLAPSLGQAASAALLRSGFLANHEQGAFDIALDSKRVTRAQGVLQGLARDQPLAALYGYRIERGLRDALLGKFIYPLRLAFPWRPVGDVPSDESNESVGARNVVDGVALLDAWDHGAGTVKLALTAALAHLDPPVVGPSAEDWAAVLPVLADAVDLADSVGDLLMAEGMHQIVQGNLERAGAAMAIVDKQALPIEPQVARTPRGGASYTQRVVVLCPDGAGAWPADRRSRTEARADAWLAAMLGDPARYRFVAHVHRVVDGHDVIDADDVVVTWDDLALSALSAVMLAASVTEHRLSGNAETGLRSLLVAAFQAKLADPATVTGLDIVPDGGAPGTLGLGHFEALAMTLKDVLDKARVVTRKDIVRVDDAIETALKVDEGDEGEYPGVDLAEIEARASTLIADFAAASDALLATVGADALLAALAAITDFVPPASWPTQVRAIDAPDADPATRDQRAADALAALQPIVAAKRAAVQDDAPATATHGQRVLFAIERIRTLLGKDFPVLPVVRLGPYASEFNASLAQQPQLTVDDPWRVHGWLAQVARVREGADRFATALSAHEALCDTARADDFRLVQFPHRQDQAWAALPDAWIEDAGTPFDPKTVPEELQAFLADRPGVVYKDIHRVAPDLAIALHVPGGRDSIVDDQPIAGLVCDEWPEFVPDPFQTAGIGFHYDAPGARPPQSILLALPPRLAQDAWSFDDVVDVLHEAFDLAQLRAVRPCDLGSNLGTLLPANYLPQTFTDHLASVQFGRMVDHARSRLATSLGVDHVALTLGKI